MASRALAFILHLREGGGAPDAEPEAGAGSANTAAARLGTKSPRFGHLLYRFYAEIFFFLDVV